MYERQFVKPVGKALALLLPRQIKPPQRIVERLCPHRYLCRNGFLAEMHEGSTKLEVFAKVVFKVHAEHGFALHTIVGVALQTDINVCTSVQNAFIENTYNA